MNDSRLRVLYGFVASALRCAAMGSLITKRNLLTKRAHITVAVHLDGRTKVECGRMTEKKLHPILPSLPSSTAVVAAVVPGVTRIFVSSSSLFQLIHPLSLSEYTIEEPPLQKEDGHFVMTMNGE